MAKSCPGTAKKPVQNKSVKQGSVGLEGVLDSSQRERDASVSEKVDPKRSASPDSPKKKKNPPHRPTLYDPKYCEMLTDFFSVDYSEDKVIAKVSGKNDYEREEVKETGLPLPMFGQFARKIGVSRDTIYEWAKVYPEFSDAMKRAKVMQEEMLVSNALKGLYQPNFSFFAMKNIHGWVDKTEVGHGLTDETYEKMKGLPIDKLGLRFQALIGYDASGARGSRPSDPKALGNT